MEKEYIKTEIEELLPIGSIISLKDAMKKMMIIGIKPKDLTTNNVYDYIALSYPEGFIDKYKAFYVNHHTIEKVYFRGYEDEERDRFIKRVAKTYKEREDK